MLGSGISVDRGRLRQLLRGSVAGLCELKLLRERQEVRVRRALRGGEDLDRQLWELERQLGELRLRAENDQENAEYEADGLESSDVFLDRAPRVGQAEARMHYASERPKSAGDLVVGSHHPRSSSSRLLVPRSMSAPYPSPSSPPPPPPPPPPPARRAEGYILSLLRRQLRAPYLRSVSADRPPAPAPVCRMASTSYTPTHRGPRRKHPPLLKGHSVEGSPPKPPRKCLSAEEPPRKRGGRRTPRSLSETSLRDPAPRPEESVDLRVPPEVWQGSRGHLDGWVNPRTYKESWANARAHTEGWADPQGFVQEWGDPRTHMQEGSRCYTLGRDGRAPTVRIGPPCRKWRSTAEISAGVPEGEARVDSEGEEEEEEEGGLVWPMQLPPRDAEGRPQMFKVKASQALKKKIMRFHTGSLKVMTTV
ncbi:guanine nucleotide-binding protein G(I)/G(S)/G(O) subunit gamma-8 isoform X1 [Phyllobates terribilis]|uniref:guanine nucleotide-binding protein G(I)/G(S)/G(O) subunit gamma-8 isoform X1 n=1 Tax=Phyllobates terribilis TaxID=111132 RepID=UPI003CCAC415